ncbi:MAG TPA: endonuclease/exonuclease/phosphatase family protein [Pyrinomonadaceae bacterium]|jgi:endonuclease/exonuclease/phosphatase family metal-dependent hydrolase
MKILRPDAEAGSARSDATKSVQLARLSSSHNISSIVLRACAFVLCLALVLLAGFGLFDSQAQSGERVVVPPLSSAAMSLLETGSPSKPPSQSPKQTPEEIKIVSYNIRWRGGEDLLKLIEQLRGGDAIGRADIIGLQEVDRNRKRTQNVNTARQMAEALGMHYAWAAPPQEKGEKEEGTGVAILSPFPLTDVERMVLPHEGPNGRRRVGIGATVRVGDTPVRVYSIHAETRLKMELKMEQLGAALEDLRRHPTIKHAVVLGDFNTIKSKDVRGARKLFTEAGFNTPHPDDRDTFRAVFIEFKLDWIWLRGLTATDSGIARNIGFSDHWPLWVKARLK